MVRLCDIHVLLRHLVRVRVRLRLRLRVRLRVRIRVRLRLRVGVRVRVRYCSRTRSAKPGCLSISCSDHGRLMTW